MKLVGGIALACEVRVDSARQSSHRGVRTLTTEPAGIAAVGNRVPLVARGSTAAFYAPGLKMIRTIVLEVIHLERPIEQHRRITPERKDLLISVACFNWTDRPSQGRSSGDAIATLAIQESADFKDRWSPVSERG